MIETLQLHEYIVRTMNAVKLKEDPPYNEESKSQVLNDDEEGRLAIGDENSSQE